MGLLDHHRLTACLLRLYLKGFTIVLFNFITSISTSLPVNVGSQPDMAVGWVKKMFVCVFFVGGKTPGGFLKTQQKFQWNSCFFWGGKRSKLIYNWGHNRTHRGAITIGAFPGAHLAASGKQCERFPSVKPCNP